MLQRLFSMIFFMFLSHLMVGQDSLYSFKEQDRYGLINSKGEKVVGATYQYIAAFSEDGYALVQKNDLLGVVDSNGVEVIPCRYPFMNHTGRGLFAVKKEDKWTIINTKEEVVLERMPGEINFLKNGYISFSEITGVGLAHLEQGVLIEPKYSRFEILSTAYVLAINEEGHQYLYNAKGELLLEEAQEKIEVKGVNIWTYRDQYWQIYDPNTNSIRKHSICEKFMELRNNLYTLINEKDSIISLYDVSSDTIVTRVGVRYQIFDAARIMYTTKENKKGIIRNNGSVVIAAQYDAINRMDSIRWRVRLDNKTGIVDTMGQVEVPAQYDYISKFSTVVALVRVNDKYGIINQKGKVVIPPSLPATVVLQHNILRYKDKTDAHKIIRFDDEGNLDSDVRFQNIKSIKINAFRRMSSSDRATRSAQPDPNQISDSLVWRYHNMAGLWGLWHIQREAWKYVPTFNEIYIHKDIGITIVKQRKKNPTSKIITKDIDLKSYEVLGVFNNSRGLPVTRREFLDIRVSDFKDKGLPVARVVFVSGKCGLIERNGRVLKKRYVHIGEFVEGKARCTKVGRMDVDNHNLIKRPLQSAESYYSGWLCRYQFDDGNPRFHTIFKKEGQLHCREAKWGFVDTFGNLTVNCQYDLVEDYSNDRAMVKKGDKWGLIDEEGIEIIVPAYDGFDYLAKSEKRLFEITDNQTFYGAVDTAGDIIVPVEYIKIRNFVEDRIAVRSPSRRWGFIDKKGNVVVESKYRLVHDFSEGRAAVYAKSRWGVIDKQGKEVIEPIYFQMGDFKEGKAWVALPKGYKGYIDRSGKLLFKGKYSRVTNFSEGRAAFYIRKKGWGLIDEKGNVVMRPKRRIKKIEAFNEYGIAKVRIGDKYRMLSKEGKLLGNTSFGIIRDYQEGYAVARVQALTGSKIGKVNLNFVFIDTLGRIVPKRDFDQLQSFSEGRAAFRGKNGKRGYINTKGEIIVAPQYFKVEPFLDNRAVVYQNYNTSGVIDTLGNEIIPIKYKSIVAISGGLALVKKYSSQYFFVHEDTKRHTPVNFEKAHAFQFDMAPVRIKGKWGVINKKGIQVVTPKYDDIKPFEQGTARVAVHRLRGVVDVEGNIIIPPVYEHVEYVGDNLFRVERGDAVGYLHQDGNWVVQLQK